MHLIAVFLFLISLSLSHCQTGIFCTTKCDCDNVVFEDIINVIGPTDCCDAVATLAKGNVNLTGNTVTGCTLCPDQCGASSPCEFDPITVSLFYS